LPLLVDRLRPVLEACDLSELILVDDESHDRSWDVIQLLAARHPRIAVSVPQLLKPRLTWFETPAG
jgi:glycosyltransferase involved in cell wall biosynthesis